MRSSEDILEDMLSQIQKQNGLMERVAQQMKAGTNSNKPSTDDFDDALSESSDEVEDNTRKMRHYGTQIDFLTSGTLKASDMTNVAGEALFALAGKAGPLGQVLQTVIEAGTALYQYMDAQLQTMKDFNAAGFQTTNGMLGLTSALADGQISYQEFTTAFAGMNDVLASMGNDGAKNFGSLMDSIINAEDSMVQLQLTNDQIANGLAGYMKQQKAYGIFDKLNKQEQAKASQSYMENMLDMSKQMGISIGDLSKTLAKSADTVSGIGTQMALMEKGMNPEDAAKTAENINMVMAGMGEFGGAVNEQLARFVAFGNLDMESPIGQMYQTNDELRALFDQTREMAMNGQLSSKEGLDALNQLWDNEDIVKSIDGNLTNIRGAFGDMSANQIIAWRNQLQNMNKEVDYVNEFWDQLINGFNRDIEQIFFGFKKLIADMFTGDFWDEVAADIANFPYKVADFMSESFNAGKVFMAGIPDGISKGIDDLMNYFNETMSGIKLPSMEEIIRYILPDFIADMILNPGDAVDAAIDGATDAVTDTMNKMTEVLESVQNDISTFKDDAVSSAKDALTSMYENISDWWSKPQSQTTIKEVVSGYSYAPRHIETIDYTPQMKFNEAREVYGDDAIAEAMKESNNQLLEALARLEATMAENVKHAKSTARTLGDNL